MLHEIVNIDLARDHRQESRKTAEHMRLGSAGYSRGGQGPKPQVKSPSSLKQGLGCAACGGTNKLQHDRQ